MGIDLKLIVDSAKKLAPLVQPATEAVLDAGGTAVKAVLDQTTLKGIGTYARSIFTALQDKSLSTVLNGLKGDAKEHISFLDNLLKTLEKGEELGSGDLGRLHELAEHLLESGKKPDAMKSILAAEFESQITPSETIPLEEHTGLPISSSRTSRTGKTPIIGNDGASASDGLPVSRPMPRKEEGVHQPQTSSKTVTQEDHDRAIFEQKQRLEAEYQQKIDREVEERTKKIIAERGINTADLPDTPIGSIFKGVSSIIKNELSNSNSELSWLAWATGFDKKISTSIMPEFISKDFQDKAQSFFTLSSKGQNHEEIINGLNLSENQKTALTCINKVVQFSNYIPNWLLTGLSSAGLVIDKFAEVLHHIPILGKVLKIPFIRPLIAGAGAFAGRFSGEIKLVVDGIQALKPAQTPVHESAKQPAMAA